MNRPFLKSLAIAAIAFGAGTYYGWKTGVVDGSANASGTTATFLESYSKARITGDVGSRDRVIDLLTEEVASKLAEGYSYSPVAYFLHPKVDAQLLKIAATHELNQEFRGGGEMDLFTEGSSERAKLKALKQAKAAQYQRIIVRLKANREKYFEQNKSEQNSAPDASPGLSFQR